MATWDKFGFDLLSKGLFKDALAESAEKLKRMQFDIETKAGMPSQYSAKIRPRARKVQMALDRVADALPMRVAHKIVEVRYGPDGATDPRFEVMFMGGRVLTFDNVDDFPTDANIAQICLECP